VVRPISTIVPRLVAISLAGAALAACQGSDIPKQLKPVPHALVASMDQLDMKETSPIFIRIFKEESTLEVWKQRRDGQYALLKSYDICKWSGEIGPKKQEGDRQAPEGFYTVTPAQMNPQSNYYLSFNIGYPNAFDQALGRTGSNLMVHGACSSAGCYSMTDESAGELFALARDSFRGGQRSFQIQAFPFRMTPENFARHRDNPNMDFWRMVKVGYDTFELTRRPPKVDVCEKRYVFNADAGTARFEASAACPPYQVPQALAVALANKQAADEAEFTRIAATLEQQDQQAADAERVAALEAAELERRGAMKAAEQPQRAAETASKPSLISRLVPKRWLWWRGEGDISQEPEPVVASAPAKTSTPPAKVAAVPAPVPVPAPAYAEEPATVTAPTPAYAEEPVAAAAPTPAITQELTPPSPPVGRFVKRKFWWDEEVEPDGATDTPG